MINLNMITDFKYNLYGHKKEKTNRVQKVSPTEKGSFLLVNRDNLKRKNKIDIRG